ncbi:MAG TPA: hypothetical protein VG795_05875 [Acidimicrobiia bacterium]|nr:hypothetical protein [Acidimicrobiia bacterium]
MVLPFLFIIAGVAYIAIAAPSRRPRRDRSVRVLPVGAQHPLSHVRSKMKAANQPVRPPEQKPAPRRRSEPPWLTPVE